MKAIHINFLAARSATGLANRYLSRRTVWTVLTLALILEVPVLQHSLRTQAELNQRMSHLSQQAVGPAIGSIEAETMSRTSEAASAIRRSYPQLFLGVEQALGRTRKAHPSGEITLEELGFDGPSRKLTVRGISGQLEPVQQLRQELLMFFQGAAASFPALQDGGSGRNSSRFEMTIHLPPTGDAF